MLWLWSLWEYITPQSVFIFHIFILPRERIQEQFAELADTDGHSKCHFAGAYFKPCSSWARSDWLQSVTSSFQGVSTCICASILGRSGTSCSNVNSGANTFICVKANAVALYLKSKNQTQLFLTAEMMLGIIQKYLECHFMSLLVHIFSYHYYRTCAEEIQGSTFMKKCLMLIWMS